MANKSLLAGLVSAAALAVASGPAAAFDELSWNWDLDLQETVTKTVTITVDVAPAGLALAEIGQIHIGDVSATSWVWDIDNNQPAGGDGQTIDLGTIEIEANYLLGGVFDGGTATGDVVTGATVVEGLVDENDVPPDINGTVTATIDLGTLDVPPAEGASFDAITELPEVLSTATAVANNASVDSAVMVELHVGQFAFALPDEGDEPSTPVGVAALNGGGNVFLDTAGLLTVGALLGVIEPTQITAESQVWNITNASVDSAATAVANNLQINLEPQAFGEDVLIADITQFALADVSAFSTVSSVSVSNYTNLGAFGVGDGLDTGPSLVSSVATAVGNNLSITVAPVAVGGIEP